MPEVEFWGHSGPGIAQGNGKSLGYEPGVSLQLVPNSLGDTDQVIASHSPCHFRKMRVFGNHQL